MAVRLSVVMFLTLPFIFAGCRPIPSVEGISKTLVISVLDKSQYDDCHIPGSIHVPFDQVENYMRKIDKGAEIILYCSNFACSTSDYVAQKLSSLGYTHVMVYKGGIAEWKQHGLPTEGPGKHTYLTKIMLPTEETSELKTVSLISMHKLAQKLHMEGIFEKNKAA